jgi:hypothetical protein
MREKGNEKNPVKKPCRVRLASSHDEDAWLVCDCGWERNVGYNCTTQEAVIVANEHTGESNPMISFMTARLAYQALEGLRREASGVELQQALDRALGELASLCERPDGGVELAQWRSNPKVEGLKVDFDLQRLVPPAPLYRRYIFPDLTKDLIEYKPDEVTFYTQARGTAPFGEEADEMVVVPNREAAR